MVVAVLPGRFDPVTYGHLDVITRANFLFDRVIVGVRPAPEENLLFSLNERIKMLEHLTRELSSVIVLPCCEPVLDFARKYRARVIIRGLRSFSDFEMEFERAKLNKELVPEIETLFITCRPELFYTSEMVKEIAAFGGNIGHLVPPYIETRVFEKMALAQEQKEARTVKV